MVVGGIWKGKKRWRRGWVEVEVEVGIPLGLLLSPSSPVGARPPPLASHSVAVCSPLHHQHRPAWGPPPPSLHMTAQKTTSRWLYSHSFVHFQHTDTRQIMLNDRRWLPEEWLLCCRCQVCKCPGATLYSHPRPD